MSHPLAPEIGERLPMTRVAQNKTQVSRKADKATPKTVPSKRRRLDPKDREREIINGAVSFFAEVGFDGSLRDLARRIGITHQNLFRYFPTKEALIERVYKEVYLNRWQREWEVLLKNPDQELEERLVAFYQAYLTTIDRYDWVRIIVYAGLKDVSITKRFLGFLQKKVIEPIGFEIRRVAGFREDPAIRLSPEELEIAWSLHGQLFYLVIRKWVYGMPTPGNLNTVIASAVAGFLAGAPAALRKTRTARSLARHDAVASSIVRHGRNGKR
jgi:AcrR family transcriptional regulator